MWIEILMEILSGAWIKVTPLAGVWIEMDSTFRFPPACPMSLPSRECGLKLDEKDHQPVRIFVTPLAGVWIEI